jgi:hypothetical protein
MNMHRVRRLASVAVVASLAVTGLSACRSQPNVAAYVGDQRITEARVQDVWDQARGATGLQAGKPFSIPRAEVVRVLVSRPVLDSVAAAEAITLPQLDYNAAAQATGVPATTDYTRTYAEVSALTDMIQEKGQGQNAPAASDADLQKVFQTLSSNGVVNGDFANFKANLGQNGPLVNTAVATGNKITKTATSMKVSVNPRYGQVDVTLHAQTSDGQAVPLFEASLDPSSTPAPVVDQS